MRAVVCVLLLLAGGLAGCAAPAAPAAIGPVVDVTWSPDDPVAGGPVTFGFQLTPASDGAQAVWTIEGRTVAGQKPEHTFAAPGAHEVHVAVTTSSGLRAEGRATVEVAPRPDAPAQEPEEADPPESEPEEPEPEEPAPEESEPEAAEPVQEARAEPPVVVAVLDTGILADHEAFDADQVVAWYDFGKGGSGVPTTNWDPEVEPYDDNGHGTAVASLVAGNGDHTPSHGPGVKLAVAKISDAQGSASWNDVARAMQWATDTVGADVISLSFYTYTPDAFAPLGGHPLLEAIERARGQGTLPVVLAGNGAGNFGLVPTMSWMHPPATSRHALVVGGASSSGASQAPVGSMDPEVTALYTATVACPDEVDCYHRGSGTSYSTPLVAGMAARIIEVARIEGLEEPDPDRLEALLKGSAKDGIDPPSFEGHGFLDAGALETALEHLRAGTTPETDPVNDIYVETVADTARGAWGG